MDGLYWKTLLKWMIWGYPYFWKHPYGLRWKKQSKHTHFQQKSRTCPTWFSPFRQYPCLSLQVHNIIVGFRIFHPLPNRDAEWQFSATCKFVHPIPTVQKANSNLAKTLKTDVIMLATQNNALSLANHLKLKTAIAFCSVSFPLLNPEPSWDAGEHLPTDASPRSQSW